MTFLASLIAGLWVAVVLTRSIGVAIETLRAAEDFTNDRFDQDANVRELSEASHGSVR